MTVISVTGWPNVQLKTRGESFAFSPHVHQFVNAPVLIMQHGNKLLIKLFLLLSLQEVIGLQKSRAATEVKTSWCWREARDLGSPQHGRYFFLTPTCDLMTTIKRRGLSIATCVWFQCQDCLLRKCCLMPRITQTCRGCWRTPRASCSIAFLTVALLWLNTRSMSDTSSFHQ